jgi:hypothetical protein
MSDSSYTPLQLAADDVPTLLEQIQRELNTLAGALETLGAGRVERADNPPAKPRVGDLRYTTGVDWNPGAGEGVYLFTSGGWVKL